MIIVWLLLGIIAWLVLGAIVLATIDDENMSLLRWASECPFGGATTVMLAWPWCVWWVRHCAKRHDEQPNNQIQRAP